jgi:general secretion pathway protein G
LAKLSTGAFRNWRIPLLILIGAVLTAVYFISLSLTPPGLDIRRAKEGTLRQDLFTLRSLISQYSLDKRKAPQSLEDLVQSGYIKVIPKDPFTQDANWIIDKDQPIEGIDPPRPGIVDVHSASNMKASDGTAYSSW